MEGSVSQSATDVHGVRCQLQNMAGRSTAAAPVPVAEHRCCRTLLGQNVSEAGSQHVGVTGWQEACVSEGSAWNTACGSVSWGMLL